MNTIGVEYELHRTCLDHRKLAHISQTRFSNNVTVRDSLWLGSLQILYEFSDFFGFAMDFNEFVLDDQKELGKNKICFEYLLLEKMRFPGSFVGYLQIIAEIQGMKLVE